MPETLGIPTLESMLARAQMLEESVYGLNVITDEKEAFEAVGRLNVASDLYRKAKKQEDARRCDAWASTIKSGKLY